MRTQSSEFLHSSGHGLGTLDGCKFPGFNGDRSSPFAPIGVRSVSAFFRAKIWSVSALLLFGALQVDAASTSQQDPVADTTSGQLQGKRLDSGLLAFLGVRYGESTAGQRRFLPPVLAAKRPGLIQARSYAPDSIQTVGNAGPVDLKTQSEDSLFLNLWTPGLTGKRPVMVWIHGGGNWQGSGSGRGGAVANLASLGDVVVVSINYRLGIFGFVDVSLLGGSEYRTSASSGLLDQRLALEWVQKNIARFGGDPGNVTVFGNSAGGVDISALLGTSNPSRLFHRAIMQSGFANSTKSLEVAQRFSRTIFQKGNIRTMADLLAKSPQQLIDIQNAVLKELLETERDLSFQPTVDGTVLEDFPAQRVQQGAARDIDLILGTTLNELRGYLDYNPELATAKVADFPDMRDLPVELQETLSREYRGRRAGMTQGQVTLDIASDYWFRLPAIRLAEAQLKYNPNVYMYLFNWRAADPALGVPHGMEVSFVFGTALDKDKVSHIEMQGPGAPAAAEGLISHMQHYWTSFARSGIPVAPSAPAWPRYDLKDRNTMELAPQSKVVADPAGEERRLYDSLTFDGRR